jgi:hypothetical protein
LSILAHVESSLIWIGSLKVEWAVRLTNKNATIPDDVTHIIQNLIMIVLYTNVLFIPVGPSRKNVVPFYSIIDVKTS